MSVIAKLFLVAVLAAVVAAPAPAATPRSELSTYLAAVKPHVAAAARASAAAVRHAEPPLLPEDTVDTTPLRADAAKMGAIAKRVAAIRPPAALRPDPVLPPGADPAPGRGDGRAIGGRTAGVTPPGASWPSTTGGFRQRRKVSPTILAESDGG